MSTTPPAAPADPALVTAAWAVLASALPDAQARDDLLVVDLPAGTDREHIHLELVLRALERRRSSGPLAPSGGVTNRAWLGRLGRLDLAVLCPSTDRTSLLAARLDVEAGQPPDPALGETYTTSDGKRLRVVGRSIVPPYVRFIDEAGAHVQIAVERCVPTADGYRIVPLSDTDASTWTCPRCAGRLESSSGEPHRTVPGPGYDEVISVTTTYQPCGCVVISSVGQGHRR